MIWCYLTVKYDPVLALCHVFQPFSPHLIHHKCVIRFIQHVQIKISINNVWDRQKHFLCSRRCCVFPDCGIHCLWFILDSCSRIRRDAHALPLCWITDESQQLQPVGYAYSIHIFGIILKSKTGFLGLKLYLNFISFLHSSSNHLQVNIIWMWHILFGCNNTPGWVFSACMSLTETQLVVAFS